MPAFSYQARTPAHTTTSDADRHPGVNADPFPVDASLDPEWRASWLAETARWADGMMEELATFTRKAARLQCKLLDPALAHNPHRPDAVQRSLYLDDEIAQKTVEIIWTEAEADRVWQSLTPEQRGVHGADVWWRTQATQERLIGAVWFRFGPDYEWPAAWRLNRLWLAGMPLTIVMDLRIHGVMDWSPNVPAPSIFTGETNEPMPLEIARQLHGRSP